MKALIARWILPLVLAFTGPFAKAQFDIEDDWQDYDCEACDANLWLENDYGHNERDFDYELSSADEPWYEAWCEEEHYNGLNGTGGRICFDV